MIQEHSIRTYVNRSRRMTAYQRASLESFYSTFCIPYNRISETSSSSLEPLSFSSIFGNDKPVVIEIGFGMGDATFQIAQKRDEYNYLGIEVFKAGVASLLGKIGNSLLSNIRIIEGDAVRILEELIMPSSISAFHIFFPDPWQKKKHNKRRFIKRPITNLLQEKLKVDGYIYMVTDWEDYAKSAFIELSKTECLKSCYNGFAPKQSWRAQTKFELKAIKEGRAIRELMFKKVIE